MLASDESKGVSDPAVHAPKRRNRRVLGRKGRRKLKKMLEIEAVLAAAEEGENNQSSSLDKSFLPSDRDYQWPAVKGLCSLDETDKLALIGQLGYFPGNALSVAARANEAFPDLLKDDTTPLVLKLYPLVLRDESDSTKSRRKRKRQSDDDDGAGDDNTNNSKEQKTPLVEPFPTMFWVTHPRLRALISKIELENRGSQYEILLKEDTKALESMKQAHLAYGKERYSMITAEDRDFISKRRWDSALDTSRGVAGMRNQAGVKCLHAHAAHYWSGCKENIIGQWVAEEVSKLLLDSDEKKKTSSSDADK